MYRFFLVFLLNFFLVVRVDSVNEILRGQSVLYGIASLSENSNNTGQCYEELRELYQGIEDNRVWAVKALDASGQPGSGFIYGNNLWIGSHAQCQEISNTKKMEVSYIYIRHADPTPFDFPPFPMGFTMAYMKHNSTLQFHTQLPLDFIIQLGLCLPQSCTTEEISGLLKEYIEKYYLEIQKIQHLKLDVFEVKHIKEDITWLFKLPKTIILLVIVGIIFLLTIIGTAYDVKQHNREKNMITGNNNLKDQKENPTTISTVELVTSSNSSLDTKDKSTIGEILRCFSLYSNVKALTKTKLSTDSIGCIHGLRFFSMLWVIMVHAIFFESDYINNVSYTFRMSEGFFAQILSNSTYAVDTYLFLSGFLVSYLFFKTKTAKPSSEKSINYFGKTIEFFSLCLNRFLRLTPPYLILIVLADVLYTFSRQNSAALSSELPDVLCAKYWWRNVLYINNLYPRSEMCLSWSWYLSIDTQFFTISMFLLILSTIVFKISAAMVFLLILINIVATAYKCYSIGYIPTMDEQYRQLDAIYDLPWNRIGPYLIGTITGYILIVKLQRQLILRKRTKFILWTIFPLINLWILFTLYGRQISVEFSAFYMGVSRTLWGVGLAWLLIACCTGNAGIINKFLSFRGFIPLSRLTYSAYLLNPVVTNMIFLGSESTFTGSNASLGLTVVGVTLLTFYLSFIYSMLFESPFILLTKQLFNVLNKKREVRKSTTSGTA